MKDHLALDVGSLVKAQCLNPKGDVSDQVLSVVSEAAPLLPARQSGSATVKVVDGAKCDVVECRICQEEGLVENLESPCACTGSLKYAHRACVQRWCNEKGDIICEICHEPYNPGYTAPPRPPSEETTIDLSWTVGGTTLDFRDPRVLALAQNHILDADYEEYTTETASAAAFCRSAALVLMALLLLRHALVLTDNNDDDTNAMFSLFILRIAGFLLPFYIMAWVVSALQRQRQRQEAADLAATEVAFILQPVYGRGIHFTIQPDSPATPQQEPHH